MRRIVVIAASMAGVRAATRLKRRLFEHEINVILPAVLTQPPAMEGPVGKRRAENLPNLELLATREVGVVEAQDIMPDLEAKELNVTSSRGSITIRYSDLIMEVPATVRLPRSLQRCGNVFGWPMPSFAANPEPCDRALAACASSGQPVIVVGNGMAALDAALLARQAGADVRWVRTAEQEGAALDSHLTALALRRLGAPALSVVLADCPADRLTLSVSNDGTRLEKIAAPEDSSAAFSLELSPDSCCFWTTPLMGRHPILREEGVFLDGAGHIFTGEGYTERLGLHLMGSGAAVPAANLIFSGADMPATPGGEESADLSAWLVVDAVAGDKPLGLSSHNIAKGTLGVRRAAVPGLAFCRAGVTLSEAEEQGLEAETAVLGLGEEHMTATDSSGQELIGGQSPVLAMSLVCDKASRTVIGVQVLGLGSAWTQADGLFNMALAALADGAPLAALARRGHTGLSGYVLSTAAAVLLNKLDTVVKGISPDELLASRDAGAEFFTLDLRSLPDWRAGHVPGAYNIPLPQLKKRLQDEVPRFTPIVLISSGGRDAYAVARKLAGLGATSLYVLDGGMRLWPYELEKE